MLVTSNWYKSNPIRSKQSSPWSSSRSSTALRTPWWSPLGCSGEIIIIITLMMFWNFAASKISCGVRYLPGAANKQPKHFLNQRSSPEGVASREFPDRRWFILSKGQRPRCLVYWWTHQKRYNLTGLWRIFEIQDVVGANIYPSEYILLAGIFDRPSPPRMVPAAPCWPFLYFCRPHSMCCVCACLKQ